MSVQEKLRLPARGVAFMLLLPIAIGAEVIDGVRLTTDVVNDFGNGRFVTALPSRWQTNLMEVLASTPITPSRFIDVYSSTGFPFSTENRDEMLIRPLLDQHTKDFPQPENVFDELLSLDGLAGTPETGANLLLSFFGDWFLHEFYPTIGEVSAGDSSCTTWRRGTMRLAQLYGTDSCREDALRDGIYLQANSDGGLPSLRSIQENAPNFTMSCGSNTTAPVSCSDKNYIYAIGDEAFNFHPGLLFWTEIFLREHNYVADLLRSSNPNWSEDRVFDTTRVIMVHIVSKIVLEEYFSGALFSPVNAKLAYKPDLLRSVGYSQAPPKQPVFLEFNYVSQWHKLFVEHIDFEDGELVGFDNFLWNPDAYQQRPAADFARAFHRTRSGSIEAFNIPPHLKDTVVEIVRDGRSRGLRTFNDYREYYQLTRLETFDEFGGTAEATQALRQLYETVDDVDFFVGILVERRFMDERQFLSETTFVSFVTFLTNALLTFDTVRDPRLWSTEFLSVTGKDHVVAADIRTLLDRHAGVDGLPCGTPFLVDDERTCDSIPFPTASSLSNLRDYVGRDYTLYHFTEEGPYFFEIFKVLLLDSIALMFGFLLVHLILLSIMRSYAELEICDKFRLVFGIVNVSTLVLTAIPYTYIVLELLYGPDFIAAFEKWYKWIFAFMWMHASLYLIEVCARLVYQRAGWMLFLHHSIYLLLLYVLTQTRSIFLFKLNLILDCHVNYEAGLFVALLVRRYSSNLKLRTRCTIVGAAIFLITRFTQVGTLLHLFVVSAQRMLLESTERNDKGLFIVGVLTSIIFAGVQFYSLLIYIKFYESDRKKRRLGDGDAGNHHQEGEKVDSGRTAAETSDYTSDASE